MHRISEGLRIGEPIETGTISLPSRVVVICQSGLASIAASERWARIAAASLEGASGPLSARSKGCDQNLTRKLCRTLEIEPRGIGEHVGGRHQPCSFKKSLRFAR